MKHLSSIAFLIVTTFVVLKSNPAQAQACLPLKNGNYSHELEANPNAPNSGPDVAGEVCADQCAREVNNYQSAPGHTYPTELVSLGVGLGSVPLTDEEKHACNSCCKGGLTNDASAPAFNAQDIGTCEDDCYNATQKISAQLYN